MKIDSNNLVRSQFNQMQILYVSKRKFLGMAKLPFLDVLKCLNILGAGLLSTKPLIPKDIFSLFSPVPRIPFCFMQRPWPEEGTINQLQFVYATTDFKFVGANFEVISVREKGQL